MTSKTHGSMSMCSYSSRSSFIFVFYLFMGFTFCVFSYFLVKYSNLSKEFMLVLFL